MCLVGADLVIWLTPHLDQIECRLLKEQQKNSGGSLSNRDSQATLSAVLVALATERHSPQKRC
jgi:hypothetical protein